MRNLRLHKVRVQGHLHKVQVPIYLGTFPDRCSGHAPARQRDAALSPGRRCVPIATTGQRCGLAMPSGPGGDYFLQPVAP